MPKFRGSRTELNVLYTFAAESMARTKYEFCGIIARKEGFLQVARVFNESARQERQHAKRMYRYLRGGEVQLDRKIAVPQVMNTRKNLEAACDGESREWSVVYPSFARVAEEEGFITLSHVWLAISTAEKYHERRFETLLRNIRAEKALEEVILSFADEARSDPRQRCLVCGFVSDTDSAPPYCPVCGGPPSNFKRLDEAW